MEKGIYLAICYCCNERCNFCPCSSREKTEGRILDVGRLKQMVDAFSEKGCPEITLSGGEPTLHPDFIELVRYIQEKGINVTILTNGEKLSDGRLVSKLSKKVDVKKLRVITTLHSSRAKEHERANRTPGSFNRSINGLKEIYALGAKLEIKHCITIRNVSELRNFYIFCDKEFPEDVNIQLCSIDYCGLPQDRLKKEMLSFMDMRGNLEKMFDLHLDRKKQGSRRKLYGINIPLCACDIYYWKLLAMRCEKVYEGYADPYTGKVIDAMQNVIVSPEYCGNCKVADLCIGTYRSAFEYFGDRLVKPYI